MLVTACIPVGPGHEEVAEEAVRSFQESNPVKGLQTSTLVLRDSEGQLGRSRARNALTKAAAAEGADWVYYLDADDLALPECLERFHQALEHESSLEAVWGRNLQEVAWRLRGGPPQKLERKPFRAVAPIHTREEALSTAAATLWRCGCFIKVRLFDRVGGWLEQIDIGEDHEFFFACAMLAESFVKLEEPLACIRLWSPRAGGPRSYTDDDPRIRENLRFAELIADYWRKRGRRYWSEEDRMARQRLELYGDGIPWAFPKGETG